MAQFIVRARKAIGDPSQHVMGDFLVDFRAPSRRRMTGASEFLKFFQDMHVTVVDEKEFGLVLTSADEPRLWGPMQSPDGKLFVGLCGRVALEQKEWDEAQGVAGTGGLASKFILKCYQDGGIERVCDLSGHFVVLLFDRIAQKFFIVTDRWGLAPAFQHDTYGEAVVSSHPDALADAAGEGRNWDLTSLAEFILTCKLSYPFTYYQRIRSLPFASIMTVALGEQAMTESVRPYFEFRFEPHRENHMDELAEELAAGFRKSVAKRTLPVVGRTAIALSGGLDSRTLLCSAPRPESLVSFCCHDEENVEFGIARAIAREAKVQFVPLRRSSDFYAEHASQGVRISAGMGCIASNHFLGFRQEIKDLGAKNLLTGCYCDYLFKGLAFNKRVNCWTTSESVGNFGFSFYASHFASDTPLGGAVRQRLEDRYPHGLRHYDTEECLADIEHRRMFPLSYEEDNAARTIPERVMGWYVPIAENDLMTTRLKMVSSMKLNRRLFACMAQKVCGPRIARIPDANTGAAVNAPVFWEALCSHSRRVGAILRKLSLTRATGGSWLNWHHYFAHSENLRSLWETPNREADEVFRQVLGKDGYSKDVKAYAGRQLGLFLQLFTLKLWFNQRS